MQWDDGRLSELLAGYPLQVDVVPHDARGQLQLDGAWQEKMSVSALLQRFQEPDSHHYYVHDLNLPPPLYPDVGGHPLLSVLPMPRRKTWWWGVDGQVSLLHYDDNENLMCQLSGSKHFLLFDVTDLPYLYARPDDYRSAIDLARGDLEEFPLFDMATPYTATIEAGDLLYVPCYWWHRVTSRGRHMAVSHIINETMEQRVRVAGRLIEAGCLDISEADRNALLSIVASDERASRRNARLRAYHREYRDTHDRSYYPHVIFHRIIEESLAQILRGHAAY